MRTYSTTQGTLLDALGDLNGKEIQKRGDICICVTASPCFHFTAEANMTCKATILMLFSRSGMSDSYSNKKLILKYFICENSSNALSVKIS